MVSDPALERQGLLNQAKRRRANERKAGTAQPTTDTQGLVSFACECIDPECERSVNVPLYVYRRVLEAGDQYLVQAAHHAYPGYRTIVSFGLIRIEESA